MNLGIMFGGKSAEHEVSCISALSIVNNIDREKYNPVLIGITKTGQFKYYNSDLEHLKNGCWEDHASSAKVDLLGADGSVAIYDTEKIILDCIFPVLHGPFGEDGKLQGILEYAQIPYVGCGVLASALCMDKAIAKEIFDSQSIPQARYVIFQQNESLDVLREKLSDFSFPVFVKPANMGSSVGITKVTDMSQLEAAVLEAMKFDRKIVVEEGIDAREIEVAVFQNGKETIVSEPGELMVNDDFYAYDTKYKKNNTTWQIPADLPAEISQEIKQIAKEVFDLMNCRGISRVDFFVDRKSKKIFLNEINTLPGFTEISMYPKLLNHVGISYQNIISGLIDLAMEDYEQKR